MSNTPIHKLRIGLVTAAIWENDGAYSVDLSRSYKDSLGNWQSARSLFQGDLLNAAKCAERAEIWINRKMEAKQ
ncbi:MAG: hypothetical protein CSA72_07260 [Rhodobacterales bacterium]|nr:MAG: hypothetical protein CSA72_07260 [Rhodobacterales bacterium]